MGSLVSSIYKGTSSALGCASDNANNTSQKGPYSAMCKVNALVLTRTSSMYFDEDGDLAHEFYEEVIPKNKKKKCWMKRLTDKLTPQGTVDLECPRLHVDFPFILCEVPAVIS